MKNPNLFYCGQFNSQQGSYPTVETVITLRDLFAAFSLGFYMLSPVAQGQLAQAVAEHDVPRSDRPRITHEVMAKRAYQLADAMLAEREKEKP